MIRIDIAKLQTGDAASDVALRPFDYLVIKEVPQWGRLEFVSIDGNIIYVRLSGNCVGCQLSSVTLSGVQAKLAEKLGRPVRVVPVS